MSTSAHDVLAAARQLDARDQPYALVSVLRVQPPASARPGDKAVVTADGIAGGWIGGGCAQPAVLRTVRQALADGRARMIRIAPAEEGAVRELEDVLEFGMACHSGGTIELFIDPVLPRARLVVIGDSPVAVALAGLAPRVGFQVSVIAQGADAAQFPEAHPLIATDDAAALADQVAPGSFVVVATQGRRDVQGLRVALALRAHTVWFVASARKAQVLRASLVESGADAEAVGAIVAPAGQPIGARTPEEIALSVLAAVVAARRGATQAVPVEVASTVVAASQSAQAPQAEPLRPARPEIAPLPPLPEIAGSCCGGGATAEARAQSTAAATATPTKAEPVAVAKTAPKSCCGS